MRIQHLFIAWFIAMTPIPLPTADLDIPLPEQAKISREQSHKTRALDELTNQLIEVNKPYTDFVKLDSAAPTTLSADRKLIPKPQPKPRRSISHSVSQWRALVSVYFPADQVNNALSVMQCESRGNPRAQNSRSSAGGLFQFLDGSWARWGNGADKYDAEANIAAAGRYWARSGWAPWSCKP